MNNYLLPHKIQKIAIGVFFVDLFALIATLLSTFWKTPIVLGVSGQSILVIILYLSVFFCVISREKIENDEVVSLRSKSLIAVSLLGLALVTLLNIVQLLLPFQSDSYLAMKEWRMEHFWTGNYYVGLAILYLINLKIHIKKTHID
jgi:hypothetical protein